MAIFSKLIRHTSKITIVLKTRLNLATFLFSPVFFYNKQKKWQFWFQLKIHFLLQVANTLSYLSIEMTTWATKKHEEKMENTAWKIWKKKHLLSTSSQALFEWKIYALAKGGVKFYVGGFLAPIRRRGVGCMRGGKKNSKRGGRVLGAKRGVNTSGVYQWGNLKKGGITNNVHFKTFICVWGLYFKLNLVKSMCIW